METNTLENQMENPLSENKVIRLTPLVQIRPSPRNPRKVIRQEMVEARRSSMASSGQSNPITLRPLTEGEKARFAPFEYLLLGGHVRLAGALLAGWETLRAVVLLKPMTEDEEEFELLMDNRWTDMSWWRWDLAIERRMNRNPKLSQRKLAIELKMSNTKVYKAMKILGTLNPAAREVVSLNLASAVTPIGVESVNPVDTLVPVEGESVNWVDTQPSVFQITESILMALADLKDPQLVEKALNLVIERKMTESQAAKLVEWVLAGGDMAQFEVPVKAPRAKPTSRLKTAIEHSSQTHPASKPDAQGSALSPDKRGDRSIPVIPTETQTPKASQPHQALAPKVGYNFQKELKAVTHWFEKTIEGDTYLNQDLKLNEDGQVTLLWADSPADQAGLKLGDYVWNVGKYANQQSNHAALEAQLQSLAAGQYPLYVVTSADWIKARTDVANGQADEFNPTRHRLKLVVPLP